MTVAIELAAVSVVAVAIPDGALVSPRSAVADAWETVSWKAVARVSVTEAGPAVATVAELARVAIVEAWSLLIVEGALEVRFFPGVVEPFPFGVDAAAAIAPRLDIVVLLRRSVRAAKIGLD